MTPGEPTAADAPPSAPVRLAHIVPSLEDRHGGPSKSVRALAAALARAGHPTDLLATADDPAVAAPAAEDAPIQLFARAAPRWLTRSPGLAAHLDSTAYDCLHHHALWLLTLRYAHDAARRRGVPLVISPRGMMSGWAWRHRRWRKRLAAVLVHPGALRGAAGWHATSPEEAADIRALGFTQPVCVAPNGVALPPPAALDAARRHWLDAQPRLRDRRVALFYSRFHRKKRLRELIELWLAESRGDWILLVAGVPEEFPVAEVAGWISSARASNRVLVADGAGRPPPYAAASLLLLPSHSENFGLVVAEALAAGVPALVTDTTPWRDLPREQAGWCEPWPAYGAALRDALARDEPTLRAMGEQGRNWMSRDFTWERAAARLGEFYRHLRHG